MRNGGVPMWFILLFGMAALGSSFHFALRADKKTLGFIRGMSHATLWATLAATAADLGAVCTYLTRHYGEPSWTQALVEGLGESTSPAIMGFSLLALVSMLRAVGQRRLDARTG